MPKWLIPGLCVWFFGVLLFDTWIVHEHQRMADRHAQVAAAWGHRLDNLEDAVSQCRR